MRIGTLIGDHRLGGERREEGGAPSRRNPQLPLPLDHTRKILGAGQPCAFHCRSKAAKQQMARMDAGIRAKKIQRSNRSMP